jgi:hypothetical protein
MERKESFLPEGDPEKAFLQDFLPVFRSEFAKARANPSCYWRLGYDPDYLMYQSPLLAWLMEHGHMSDDQLAAFCRHWYLQALADDPMAIARKIAGQMEYFFIGDSTVFFGRTEVLRRDYPAALSSLPTSTDPASPWSSRIYVRYLEELKGIAATQERIDSPSGVYDACKHLFGNVWLIYAVFLLILSAAFMLSRTSDLRIGGIAALILWSAPFGNALTVAVIHALGNDRYRYTYSDFLLLAFAAMAAFCVCAVLSMAIRRLP